jgi:hypothetical protein
MGVHGMLVRLFGEFVSGQMISFAVGYGGGGVGVSCEVVEFCDSIVRALWHGALLKAAGPCDGRVASVSAFL